MHLEDIAVVKIAITLWTCRHETIALLDQNNHTDEWLRVTNVLCGHSSKLPLPEVLKAKINKLLPFISFEIFKFNDYLFTQISLNDKFLKHVQFNLCWKTQGIIDRKKLVKKLIDETTLSLSTRYELACVFCFEEDILKLWNKLTVYERSPFLSTSNQTDHNLNNVNIWSLYNGKQETILSTKSIEQGFESVSTFEFLCSVNIRAPEAAEFYFKKIPPTERIQAIIAAMNILKDSFYYNLRIRAYSDQNPTYYNGLREEIVVFLFTQTHNESIETFVHELENYNIRVLECFLEWPFWEFFLCTFAKLQPHFQGDEYIDIMILLRNKILKHCVSGDYSYLLILKDVWKISSKPNKESIYSFLPSLFSTVLQLEKNLVSLILNDLPPAVRTSLFFTNEGVVECIILASNKKWNILEIIVNSCMEEERLEDFQSLFTDRSKMEELFDLYIDLEDIDNETVLHVYKFIEEVIKKRVIRPPHSKKFCGCK